MILRDGGSWSGHEKNCCFLNTHSPTFADVSSVTGFDFDSDTRGIALVDWDHDGDLDLWISQRTAPRVRYLENQATQLANNSYLAIRLQGATCNRDAIGARVELVVTRHGEETRLVRTRRAGEGFLSQSSKWLHFGLGDAQPKKLTVHWPSGDEQVFDAVSANQHYRLEQDGQLRSVELGRTNALAHKVAYEPTVTPNVRLVPARRFPLPDLAVISERGPRQSLPLPTDQTTLITLWATWCQPCAAEIRQLHQHSRDLQHHQVNWIPLNVDDFQSDDVVSRIGRAKQWLTQLKVDMPPLLATASAVECLDAVQKVLVARPVDIPVPCSFLVDRQGRVAAVYKGTIEVEQMLSDVVIVEGSSADPRDRALPFPGRWTMNPFAPDLLALPRYFVEINRPREALAYLLRHVEDPPAGITSATLSKLFLQLGQLLRQQKAIADSEPAFQQALRHDPQNVTAAMLLAETLLLQKRTADAIVVYQKVLESVGEQPLAMNNLAWLLATSKDGSLRNPFEALMYARSLCDLTEHRDPRALDTLAVALAADHQFPAAVETLQKAIEIAKAKSLPTERMVDRLQLFQQEKIYLE